MAHANNMPPLVQGPSLDCSVTPNDPACQNTPQTPATQTCPDGSVIDASATCPTPTQTCPDGSVIDASATCPTPTQTCPDGSQPNADGSCPTQPTTCPGDSQPDAAGNCVCPDGSQPNADGSCSTQPPCSCTSTSCTSPIAFVVDTPVSGPPCGPVAVANLDPSMVNEGDTITLDGSKSTDSGGGNSLLYLWEQTGGPAVDLSDYTVANPTFTAPKDLSDKTKLTFKLVVTDNLDVNNKAYHGNPSSAPATVDVNVCASKIVTSLSSKPKNVPFPDPATGSCDYSRVDVRQTGAGSLGSSSASLHLFIVYTDSTGQEYFYRGGPLNGPLSGSIDRLFSEGNTSPYCPPNVNCIATDSGLYEKGTIDWGNVETPNARSITVLTGPDAHGKGECFANELTKIKMAGIPYKLLGPNSNTVAKDLLKTCGVPSRTPGLEPPGWFYGDIYATATHAVQ